MKMNINLISTHAQTTLGGSKKTLIPLGLDQEEFEEFIDKFSTVYPSPDDNIVDYPRPTYQFPDLNSPGGNTFSYLHEIMQRLKECGFKMEAKEVSTILSMKKDEIFSFLSKYVNFGETIDWPQYDQINSLLTSQGINQEFSPLFYSSKSVNQLPEFTQISLKSIQKLEKDNFNFNTLNCYHRNMLWYTVSSDDNVLEYLLKNTDIDIFHIDHFQTTPLHHLIHHSSPEYNQSIQSCISKFLLFYKHLEKINESDLTLVQKVVFKNYMDNKDHFENVLLNNLFHPSESGDTITLELREKMPNSNKSSFKAQINTFKILETLFNTYSDKNSFLTLSSMLEKFKEKIIVENIKHEKVLEIFTNINNYKEQEYLSQHCFNNEHLINDKVKNKSLKF